MFLAAPGAALCEHADEPLATAPVIGTGSVLADKLPA